MTEMVNSEVGTGRRMLSKVPEVTLWFWVIKVLCTTVGETFADWINTTLGVGLDVTAVVFTVVLAVVLGVQLRMDRYVPFVYWLTVVVVSVAGTLYTDILTDDLGVPLAVSTSVFALALAVVFGVWFARERTLSIHSIVTLPRELWYWLAVLVTFALGTAVGDWTLQVTGWGPGISVLLPAGLILAIALGWRFGANAVLSFWLAYILTRPLGANLGDWLASPTADHGLGLGTAITSVVFLVAILAVVVFLTRTRSDVIDAQPQPAVTDTKRERIMLGYYVIVAVLAGSLLAWAAAQPHADRTGDDESPTASASATPGHVTDHFPAAEVGKFRTITQDTLAQVQAGAQDAAKTRIKDLETAWDQDESTLKPLDGASWTVLDGQIDEALHAVRARKVDQATEVRTLTTLLATLG
ncbi:COG4705 family protein [Nocardia heshunensis]